MENGTVTVYTDGGCSGNPGAGGWAYVLVVDGERKEGSGGEPATTNNRMELTAVINALDEIAGFAPWRSRAILLHTDSQYVQRGMTEWIGKWLSNGWKTAAGDPVKNRDLWERLRELSTALAIEWRWVKGHEGIELNERCDALVQEAIAQIRSQSP